MPPPVRKDPFTAQHFRIEIDGVTAAGFVSCSGLVAETEVIDYRLGNDKTPMRKLPGLHKFTNITLKRGYTADRQLWDWYKGVLDGSVQRRSIAIVLMDDAGTDLLRWVVHNAWPTKYEGPTLNASSNDVAMETIELAHEGFELA
jgi:phage tail-like protein